MKQSTSSQSLARGVLYLIGGLTLAILLQLAASSYVAAQVNIEDVVPFITTQSSNPVGRIGSLFLGLSSIPEQHWIKLTGEESYKCTWRDATQEGGTPEQTCMEIAGDATFSKLWVMTRTLINGQVFVTDTAPTPGPGWGNGLAFIIEDIAGAVPDSMMISGLGRYVGGNFFPQNHTSLTTVCATPNGMMVRCP